MGRFDALTKLDNKTLEPTPPPAPQIEQLPEPLPSSKATVISVPKEEVKKTRKIQVRKPAKTVPSDTFEDALEKYSTRIKPSLLRKIKIFAAQNDLRDYEVIERALLFFLEKK